MTLFRIITCILLPAANLICLSAYSQDTPDTIEVLPTDDFKVSCNAINPHWDIAKWHDLPADHPDDRATRVKTLYSSTGIYFLMDNEDRKITATKQKDFDSLWVEDVAEVFLWPDTSMSVYFEYEISPLNRELVLIIPNFKGEFVGWQPWTYTGNKRVQHCTKIVRSKKAGSSSAKDWYAEFFIPYALLYPMVKETPKAGSVWRGNFYRSDADDNKTVEWSWKRTQKTFHEYQVFGRLLFR